MGVDKAALPWGNETVLQHLVRRLQARLQPLILVKSPTPLPIPLPADVVQIQDDCSYQGPLVGFRNGLVHAPVDQPVLLCGCDFPFLESSIIDYLHDHLDTADAVVMESQDTVQPLVGLYQPRIFEKIEALIKDGKRSMNALLNEINYRLITTDEWRQLDPAGRLLTNINTPEEYSAAHRDYLAGLGR